MFGRLKEGVAKIEAKIPFSADDRLGMLTFCPTNLGTTIRASVHIKLPKLAKGGQDALQAVADKFQLQVGLLHPRTELGEMSCVFLGARIGRRTQRGEGLSLIHI